MTSINNSQFTFLSFSLVKLLTVALIFVGYLMSFLVSEAATLSLSPGTGVYESNKTFSVRVSVNTQGKPINAADATIAFNPSELSVVSVNRNSSIFNLWVAEPTFSNSAGTIKFSGGLPSGYTGGSGNVMTVTFRPKGAGTARVRFTDGSVLANDGKGTNVLTSMNSATFTIQPKSVAPEPEIIEYIAPANTPAKPVITSGTHPDPSKWYNLSGAKLNWKVPGDILAIRTLLDNSPATIPTKVYENPISSIDLEDLEDGVSYFHLQFKNSDGWGRVTHYRLGVDTKNPSDITIKHAENTNLANPTQTLLVTTIDETSLNSKFIIKLDNEEQYEYVPDKTSSSSEITLDNLSPGYHSVIIEVFDMAGNSIVGTHSFTIESFNKPSFTDYPTEINDEVIPVIKGETRPNSTVQISLSRVGSEVSTYSVQSSETGEFIFIPEGTFTNGVYELSAVATDEFGAQSQVSDVIRIAVQQPGYLRIGSLIVSILSVIIPMLILLVLLILSIWYLVVYTRRFRRRVTVESTEALEILRSEFTNLQKTLRTQESTLASSRKTKKLTKAETEMVEVLDIALQKSQRKVEKEIQDVTKLTRKKK